MTGWLPTFALLRAGAVAVAALLAGVLSGRPALVVLAAPFVALVGAALWNRPTTDPVVASALEDRTLREGESTTLRTTVTSTTADSVALAVRPTQYVGTASGHGVPAPTEDGVAVATTVVARRWGVHEIAGGQVAVTSPWAGFRWGPQLVPTSRLLVLPQASPFDVTAQAPHPIGLVGAHRSLRNGEGQEFSGIRPFVAGDRLRRIHWRSSLRTGALQVVTTNAEQDSAVVLVVDALADVGDSGGVDGEASSLDITVRAAAALAEHHLRIGDRVGLRVLARNSLVVPPRTGARQRRRILESLALVDPGRPDRLDATRIHRGLGAGTVVLVLSPLLGEDVTAALAALSRSGLPVVAVDTSPADLALQWRAAPLSTDALAWRIRMLEREVQLSTARRSGTPVVPWRGPGTLDDVLRRLARRAAMPRVATR